MTLWYRTGTASVANGSPAVTGALAAWSNQVLPGDSISFDAGAKWYEILSVTDNTHLALGSNFGETTVAGGAYAIQRTSPQWSLASELSTRLGALLAAQTDVYNGSGAPGDSLGSDGAMYFDTTNKVVYGPKASGTWGTSFGYGSADGSAGYVQFAEGGLLKGDSKLNWDNTNKRLFIGHTAALSTWSGGSFTPALQQIGASAAASTYGISRHSADAGGPFVVLAKSRHATAGSHTIVQSGDRFGSIRFEGSDGTNFIGGAAIYGESDGTPGASNDMPGRLVFLTTPDGSGTLTERMRIDNAGNVGIRTTTPLTPLDVMSSGSGTVATFRGHSTNANGAWVDLKPEHIDGYSSINFYPEQGSVQDMSIVVHKYLSGTSQGTTHRHMSIYSSPSIGAAPVDRIAIQYGVSDAQVQFSQCHVDFDTSAAPGSGGGYVTQLPLQNNGFIKSWNALGTLLPNIIGLNGANQLEVGATGVIGGISFYPGGSTGVTIDPSGNTIVGHTAALVSKVATSALTPRSQVTAVDGSAAALLSRFSADANGPGIHFGKSRGATIGSYAVVQSGDALGQISWAGADGTDNAEGARIRVEVDGTPGAGDMPSRMMFYTSADGSESPSERVRIDSAGNVGIGITAAASTRLHVSGGNVIFTDTNTLKFTVNYAGTTGIPAGSLIGTTSASGLSFIGDGVAGTAGVGVNISAFSGAAWFRGLSYLNNSGTPDLVLQQDGGNVIVGTASPLSVNGLIARGQLYGTSNATAAFTIGLFDATAGDFPRLQFYRSKNAAIGSATVVASGDALGGIDWIGAQETSTFATQNPAAAIRAFVDGTVTSGGSADMPGRIVFYTTPNGSGTLTERMRIDNAGNVGLNVTPVYLFHVVSQSDRSVALYLNGSTVGNNAGFTVMGGTGDTGGIGWRSHAVGVNFTLSATNVPTVNGGTSGFVKAYAIGFAAEDTDAGMTFWGGTGAGATMTKIMTLKQGGGMQMGAPTGGDKGAGTINAAGDIYKNNTAFTNPRWALQHHYTGKVDEVGPYALPIMSDGRKLPYAGLLPIDEAEAFTKREHELPLMLHDLKGGMFARGDLMLASLEEAYLYIFQLNKRVQQLEAA